MGQLINYKNKSVWKITIREGFTPKDQIHRISVSNTELYDAIKKGYSILLEHEDELMYLSKHDVLKKAYVYTNKTFTGDDGRKYRLMTFNWEPGYGI